MLTKTNLALLLLIYKRKLFPDFAPRHPGLPPSLSTPGPIRICLTVTLRQPEESSDPAPRVADWFCVVDRSPATTEEQWTLADGSVVLSLSATRSDATAVADLSGIDVVQYAQLTKADQSALRQHIESRAPSPGQ